MSKLVSVHFNVLEKRIPVLVTFSAVISAVTAMQFITIPSALTFYVFCGSALYTVFRIAF